MEDLFNNQWSVSNGMSEMSNHRFVTWCGKLAGLGVNDFARGFENLEEAKAVAAQEKKHFFPPDYASFIGYTRKSADVTASMQAIQARSTPVMITKQLTQKERDYGYESAAALLNLFG